MVPHISVDSARPARLLLQTRLSISGFMSSSYFRFCTFTFCNWTNNYLQAVAFLIPTFMWHQFEGGRVASFSLDDVRENYHEMDRWRHSVETFVITLRQNNWYLTKFLFCEIFQLLLLLSIIHTTDMFLSGMFYTLGPRTVDYLLTPPDIRNCS